MLKGVIQIQYPYLIREVYSSHFPYPCCSIAQNHDLFRMRHAAQHGFLSDHAAEIDRFVKAGNIRCAVRVSLWRLSLERV